jgi:hypothetical protein
MSIGRVEASNVVYECFDGDGIRRRAEAVGPTAGAGSELMIRDFVLMRGEKFPVTKIGGFGGWNGVQVVIPNNVEEIGEGCFYGCASLCEIMYGPESKLGKIGAYAFSGCNLTSVAFPSCLQSISERAFEDVKSVEADEGEDLSAANQ